MENSSVMQSYVTDKGIDFVVAVVSVIVALWIFRAFTK